MEEQQGGGRRGEGHCSGVKGRRNKRRKGKKKGKENKKQHKHPFDRHGTKGRWGRGIQQNNFSTW